MMTLHAFNPRKAISPFISVHLSVDLRLSGLVEKMRAKKGYKNHYVNSRLKTHDYANRPPSLLFVIAFIATPELFDGANPRGVGFPRGAF